jgi:hypothetical protein
MQQRPLRGARRLLNLEADQRRHPALASLSLPPARSGALAGRALLLDGQRGHEHEIPAPGVRELSDASAADDCSSSSTVAESASVVAAKESSPRPSSRDSYATKGLAG